MANLRELMLRLRPAGAPGPASGAGVPSDRRVRVEQELEPVFEALAAAVAEGHRIRLEGQTRAAQRISEGEARSRAMLAQAAVDASATRAELAARLRAQAGDDAAKMATEAHAAAAQVREMARASLPERVERVMTRVREQLAALVAAEVTRR